MFKVFFFRIVAYGEPPLNHHLEEYVLELFPSIEQVENHPSEDMKPCNFLCKKRDSGMTKVWKRGVIKWDVPNGEIQRSSKSVVILRDFPEN